MLAPHAAAQQPGLQLVPRALSRTQPSTMFQWVMTGRPGDVYLLLADGAAGSTSLFGRSFDLAFSPSLFVLDLGMLGFGQQIGSLSLQPPALPSGASLFLQMASFEPTQGLASLLVSNVDSFGVHDAAFALTFSFENMQLWPEPMTGSFDPAQTTRLQALPAGTRTVRPLPPQAVSFPIAYPWQPLHPSGSRFQMVLRAEDLGAAGPERLVGVRWRPLFGTVTDEFMPVFFLTAAHSNVVPNYTLDPLTNQPVAPESGLAPLFAQNPVPGVNPVTMHAGPYSVQAAALVNGYMPFPVQQPFDYDGSSSLLLETRCLPRPGFGPPVNFQTPFKMGHPLQSAPAATRYASAGSHGQPVPLLPFSTTSGTGDTFLFDWELVFERTQSVAVSPWQNVPAPQNDYDDAIVCSHTPPGTSIAIEFRGRTTASATPTPWVSSPNALDGMPWLQFRVTMTPDAATGAVPWIDTLIFPVD